MPYTIAAVDRALTLLELLAEHPNLGVTEIATFLGGTKSQAFRLLYTLERRGFVRKDPVSRHHSLGYRALYLGDKVQQQSSLIELVRPYLDELVELCRENVHLVVREGTTSVCIALRESPQPLRLYAQVGRSGPLHAGGASKVLLAYAPNAVQEQVLSGDLEIFTAATLTDPSRLRQLLEVIRNSDFYESADDLDEGAFSIAAPIRDYSDEVIAALSIAGPASRLTTEIRGNHRRLIREYSRKISRALGWAEAVELEATGEDRRL